ncbi:ATP-binding protein [Candidatus Chrysopegis kryptomonas]|uniref:AAA+ ATPase domain-containing protein n=1 Tax=Candidatus Chryseopegocella kryptomonas TaxID=1633643 RepID=A0A0P1NW18_9BACT|nr:ATP-binding protein [Candidatus Chrysopegis kryptomonas]CUT03420.1 hypothetical protein JGI23_01471 [Candidatus Chrysopegis kryptomonas]
MNKIYPRRIESKIIHEIEKPEIILLTGMRQVGKTTLMKTIFERIQTENKIFLDLENPLNQKVFEEENYDNIIHNLASLGLNPKKKMYVFLDEVQLAPNIVKAVKYLYDSYQIKFFLTGSSSFYLKNLFPESLAGRKVVYELFPLDFEEFLIFKEINKNFPEENHSSIYEKLKTRAESKDRILYEKLIKLYDEYLKFGGFPKVVLEEDINRKRLIIEDIFKSYLKDVKSLGNFKEINKLRDLIILLSASVGLKLEISGIATKLGVSRETIYSYLNFLEHTYFIFLVPPFVKNVNGEVRGAKKVYFCDTGILNYLGKLTEGAIFENAVFLNLIKFTEPALKPKINYYQRYKGSEIDFILNEKIAIEAKLNPQITGINKLKRISQELGLPFFIISKDFSTYPEVIPSPFL